MKVADLSFLEVGFGKSPRKKATLPFFAKRLATTPPVECVNLRVGFFLWLKHTNAIEDVGNSELVHLSMRMQDLRR